ncbi:MAG: CDP-glycerol glycerophosphotransferase family protein [Clostridiales bacterium]|nr:CDP-glycerol glycerophosphotransferase family protein [Clostridiales bacterium]
MGLIKVLYIDPGTGGMLFTVLFGIFGVAIFSFRALIIKIKYSASGDKNAKLNQKKIPIAIFAEDKRYWNTFETVLDEFEKRKQKVVYMTCSKDDPVFNKKYEYITGEFIGEGNKAYSRLNLLNASVVLSSTPSLGVFQWKRSKNVDCYIHIPHMASDIILYRMFSVDRFDAIILPGKYQEKPLRQLEEIHGIKPRDMELCGIPYMDVMKKRLDAAGEVPAHERTVLLAPTWGENGILTKYGERLIDALVSTGYKVIVRPHPQSFIAEKEIIDRLTTKYNDPSKVEWNRDNDNFEVLRRSDILISDFSGVIFDFSLVFNKPVIYTDPSNIDTGVFDAYWIDETPWTFRVLSDLGIELNDSNIDNIKDVIDKCLEDPSFEEGRNKARSEAWANIGQGAARSVDFVMRKYKETVDKSNAAKQETAKAVKAKTKKSKKRK